MVCSESDKFFFLFVIRLYENIKYLYVLLGSEDFYGSLLFSFVNSQASISMTTGITTWYSRRCFNFVVRVVQELAHPCPLDLSSKIVSNGAEAVYCVYGELFPPNNMTPFPSGDVAIAVPRME